MAGSQKPRKKKPPKKKPEVIEPAGKLKAEDLFVRRNTAGELEPITVPVPAFGGKTIKVLPTTIGSIKGLTALDQDAALWPLGEKIRYVTEHVVEPDMSGLTEEEATENLTLWDLDMILIAAVQAGGPQRRQRQGKV